MSLESTGAILSRREIQNAIESGEIIIQPYDPDSVGAASIDLTLSNEFRSFIPCAQPLKVTERTSYEDITVKTVIPEGETYLLPPGKMCLGITLERVALSDKICGLLEGRSRFARLGLLIHITAGFINPGINNRQVLEIYNASNHVLELIPGTKLCQLIFIRMFGTSKYNGFYKTQNSL
ncbi:dCTP deaminase, dUMP-forming-like [Schistocerca gregaria]|uniref:dCTP deaminase, dUMP-forming-like n=1 Tax=Schistocerca gregaria TaxID=7010 RepID=UPI00211EB286|nr:dCTP deaminase, dUMP-forming-like [Schistocerca gregaria]